MKYICGLLITTLMLTACAATPSAETLPPTPAPVAPPTVTTQPPTATANAPTVAPTEAQPTATPVSTITPTPGILPTSAAAAFRDSLPEDEQGRMIGGPFVPYLNYAPTMITGKSCPRMTKWTWQVVKLDPPLRPYGVADDPCVVQNAIDDFVRTEFADPAVNTPETMPSIEPLYATDPAIRDGLQAPLRDSMLKNYRDGRTPFYRCDKSRFKLLDASPRTPLIADNSGRVSGNALQLTVFVVAQNVEPYSCKLLAYKDGSQVATLTKTAEQLRGTQRVLKVGMLWNAAKRRWVVYDYGSAEIDAFYATAKTLWDASPLKP